MGEGIFDKIRAIIPQRSAKKDQVTLPPPKNIVASDFEGSLFDNGGVLVFDPQIDIADISSDIARSRVWYDNHPVWSKEWKEKGVFRLMNEGSFDYSWRQFFSGQVPARWKDWREACGDFEKAAELGIQLSKTLVDAGVSHPVHHTVEAAGISQKLDLDQLSMVMANPNVPGWGVDQVLEAQRKNGISEKVINQAKTRAQEVIREREKRQKRSKIETTGNNQPKLDKG